MKKNILILILVLISTTLVIFAKIKAEDAELAKNEVKAVQEEAMQLTDMARQQAEDAAAQARRAEVHALNLAKQLKECQSK